MCDGLCESRVVYFSRFLSDSFSITAPENGFYHLKKKTFIQFYEIVFLYIGPVRFSRTWGGLCTKKNRHKYEKYWKDRTSWPAVAGYTDSLSAGCFINNTINVYNERAYAYYNIIMYGSRWTTMTLTTYGPKWQNIIVQYYNIYIEELTARQLYYNGYGKANIT